MRNNKIEVIPDDIGGLTNLLVFDAVQNKITQLPDSTVQLILLGFGLTILCACVSVCVAITKCAKLQTLSLDYNELLSIPDNIGQLGGSLRLIGLRYNKLTALPTSLGQCTKLKELNVEGNQLNHIPMVI